METKILHYFEKIAKLPVYGVMVIILVSMFFGAADLFIKVGTDLFTPSPNTFVLNVSELLDIFSLSLIIVIGYELSKSIILIVKSNLIPVDAITKIAAIAVLNKMITADYSAVDAYKIAATALVLLSIGATHYFFSKSYIANSVDSLPR
jgi:uncharacterized membrane protein (DUF373 family)